MGFMNQALLEKQQYNNQLEADYDFEMELEQTYAKYHSKSFVIDRFKEVGFENYLNVLDYPVTFGLALVAEMAVRKRAKISTLVGLLWRHFDSEEEPFQACADAIGRAINLNLVNFDSEREEVVVAFELDSKAEEMLKRFQYPLPMVEPPQHVLKNTATGYRSIKGSLLLRNNHHGDDICLEHINRVNQQALSINMDVVAFVQNHWKNISAPKANETQDDYLKRRSNYLKYTRGAYDVMRLITSVKNKLWLTHKYDKRGRTYCQGYHVNYQGNDWNKACVQFAHAEKLNEA